MILFTQGAISENFIVTLSEKVTILSPFYLFVFKNTTTKAEVKFFKSNADELSSAITRYNEFNINTLTVFGTASGQWQYEVYQAANTSTQVTTGMPLLENGKMVLQAAAITITGHNPTTTYKGYAG